MTASIVSNTNTMLTPITDIVAIKKQFLQYEKLKASLLTSDDTVLIQGKKRIKKSGFRKLATAFGISVDVIKEEKEILDKGFVRHITAKAIAPNGRYVTCCASCASTERKFTHLENDVRATAQTRASNRSIADLIGAGEVSAEEIVNKNQSLEGQTISSTTKSALITTGQKNYLTNLLHDRYAGEELERALQLIPGLTKWDASQRIQKLID